MKEREWRKDGVRELARYRDERCSDINLDRMQFPSNGESWNNLLIFGFFLEYLLKINNKNHQFNALPTFITASFLAT